MGEGDYSADSITVLEGLDAVRYRPEMYVGRLGRRGVIGQLTSGAMCLGLDREWSGASAVDVTVNEDDSVTCAYVGRSFSPVILLKGKESNVLELLLTVFAAGCWHIKEGDPHRERLCRTPLVAVNAFSARLVARSAWEGVLYEQEFLQGRPQSPPLPVGPAAESGIALRFWPDLALLRVRRIDARPIADWARRQGRLAPGVAVRFRDARR